MPKPIFSDDGNPHSAFELSCTPLSAQPATAQAPHGEANPSSAEELSSAPDPARWATEKLRLIDSVASDMNTSAVHVENGSESSENYHADETADYGRGSDDDITGVENCHQEMVVPRAELAESFLGSPVLHVPPESKFAAPACLESSSVARDTVLGDSAHAPLGSMGGLEEPQTRGFSLPTPASDHASDTGKGVQINNRQRKRDFSTTGGVCESLELRLAKRMRLRRVDNGSESPALPTRTLRALPSRVPAGKSSKKLSKETETQLPRSVETPKRSETDGPIGLADCGKDTVRPNGSLIPALSNPPERSWCKETGRGRSPTISNGSSLRTHYFSSANHQTETCGLVPRLPVTPMVNPPAAACHTCGFSAKHLLRMINTLETLNGGSAQAPDEESHMDMLELFLGYIKNYATERLYEKNNRKPGTFNTVQHDHAAEAVVGLARSDTFKRDSSDDNTDDNDGQSDGQNDGDSCDHYPSPNNVEENMNRSKRRRWTDWEEERLRVYLEEGKEWSWIAERLHRSEAAVTQHWVIMERKDKESAK
ncbi:hypothetical protein LZ32DRAFT_175979 [Colletotrichum eremochloae]|nr:hypothetical protein LZ32DRAFT_175979 [Colletotrichum eremochloae]